MSARRTRGVTIVTPGFHPAAGGVEAHTTALATELARRGVDVEVLTSRRGITKAELSEYAGCRVETYPAWRIRAMSVSPRLVVAAIRRRRTGRVMHIHSYHAATSLALAGRRTPTVFTPHYHGNGGHTALANVLHRGYYRLARLLLRRCDAIICVSSAEATQLRTDFPASADRILVIPNGVAREQIRAARAICNELPTVLAVGRLESYKRFDAVISAFALMDGPVQLVIIGEGSQRGELESLVAQLKIDGRVRLLGRLDDATLCRWLATASVFVSMSQREAFGMAPLEAAVAGCRVVLSDIPAHREIASQFLGDARLVPAHCAPALLAAEISQQLTIPASPAAVVPDWRDIADTTASVYAAAARPFDFWHRPPESTTNNQRPNRKLNKGEINGNQDQGNAHQLPRPHLAGTLDSAGVDADQPT